MNAATIGLTGESETISDGFILVAVVLFWSVVLDALSYRWPRLESLIKARPRPLIKNGEINHRVLRRELMTEHEVISQLRLRGISDLSRVQQAHIEPNGMVSVMLREPPEAPEAPLRPSSSGGLCPYLDESSDFRGLMELQPPVSPRQGHGVVR